MQFSDALPLVFLGLALAYLLDAIFEISPRLTAWINRELDSE